MDLCDQILNFLTKPQRELYLVEEQAGEEAPYERLLGDAMAGDGVPFLDSATDAFSESSHANFAGAIH